MRFLVDANVLVYAVTAGPRREPSLELLEAVSSGAADGATSVAVLEEVWHLELGARIPELGGQTRRARTIFDEPLPVSAHTLDLALALEADAELGANDRLHVATCLEHELAAIVSADRAFDRIEGIERIDPLDEERLRSLWS